MPLRGSGAFSAMTANGHAPALGPRLRPQAVVDVGGGEGPFTGGGGDLVQAADHVAGGVEALDRGSLVVVDEEAAARVQPGAGLDGEAGAGGDAEGRIDRIEAQRLAGLDVEGGDAPLLDRDA